ncbi:MAG: hypothetical protein AABY32_01535 [Nanoarchaeota archaeon]
MNKFYRIHITVKDLPKDRISIIFDKLQEYHWSFCLNDDDIYLDKDICYIYYYTVEDVSIVYPPEATEETIKTRLKNIITNDNKYFYEINIVLEQCSC